MSTLHGCAAISVLLIIAAPAHAADFNFYGRTGDAIEINLGAGLPAGTTFAGLNTSGFAGHTVLTSDALSGQAFASSGRLWVFANPARNTPALGDANAAAKGFQGVLAGSLVVNGVSRTFSVTVQPGYTGSGAGAVGQSSEQIDDPANNPLFVAQQQQRLRYLGFVPQGGTPLAVDGDFGPATDSALRTFQGAFVGGNNTTQANVDGIIGPNTAGWLNAQNAPHWVELVDPDPQRAGTFSINTMIGAFDIYPGADPGTGNRTGNTPQPERFGTSWTADIIAKGSALAKATTGRTQRINAISRSDGYASSCCHNTHRVGMDIDLGTVSSTWNYGNGVTSAEEQIVINHAVSFANAGASGRLIRVITSNQDIYDGIDAASNVALYYDESGGHQNHLHLDVGPPSRIAGRANLAGDFNLDDVVNHHDFALWQTAFGATGPGLGADGNLDYDADGGDFLLWQRARGNAVPPSAGGLAMTIPETRTLGLLASTLLAPICRPRMRRVRR
jgi:peptidoglycan hydrolase-like protein with peptidoglycan-binding domain